MSFDEYVIEARFAIHASNEDEAYKLITGALRDRIDGHLLSAQRQARVLSVRVDDGFLVDHANALHDVVRTYEDATVTAEPPKYAEDLYEVVRDMWLTLQQKAFRL